MEKIEKKKVLINKVKNRLLDIWPPSVRNGLEDETQISDFEDKVKIGQGSFGQVFRAKHKKTNRIYAVKAIDKTNKINQKGKCYFKREIEIMYKIKHTNIVKLYTHFEDNNFCYFVMEYVNNGNLFDNLQKQRKKCFDKNNVAHIIKDLLSAVYYLHNMNPPIIHRDIKLENILIHENGKIKLTDFGWSNYIIDDEIRDTFCGTPVYQAPEMLNRKEHDHKVDIWCIGVIMFEIYTGYLPFNTTNREFLEDSIKNVKINWPFEMDKAAKDLIYRILKHNPDQRLGIEEILKHPFFSSIYPNPTDCLIKPNYDNCLNNIYVISKHTQDEQLQYSNYDAIASNNKSNYNNTNIDEEFNTLKNKYSEALKTIKMLEEKLELETNAKLILHNKIINLEKELHYNMITNDIYNNNLIVNDIEMKDKQMTLNEVELLKDKNLNLLNNIQVLNENMENQKNIYKKDLNELQLQLNKFNVKYSEIETSVSNYRDSLNNNSQSLELNNAKKEFNKEIEKLKEIMNIEREKYNYVIKSNIDELNKITSEKNAIKEDSYKYFEKLVSNYDEKLKQKDIEIENLKIMLKKKS